MTLKPQLVIQDFGGEHNRNLEQSASRLLKGGSWKKQRCLVIVPASDDIPAKICLSHWSLAFPPNNGVLRMLALGMEVGDAYSTAIENILAHPDLNDWEYIVTIEHDNAPPPDGVVKLIERMEEHPEYACISGLYFTKGPGGVAQIWGDPNDMPLNFRPQIPDVNGGLKPCNGTGMGFAVWRTSMFKDQRLKRPWFRTLNGKNNEGVATQDLAFWADAHKYGFRCAVDCSVKVGHYDKEGKFGPPDTMW
jgi:hypothetical protein